MKKIESYRERRNLFKIRKMSTNNPETENIVQEAVPIAAVETIP